MKIVIKNVLNIGNGESHWFLGQYHLPMANITKGVSTYCGDRRLCDRKSRDTLPLIYKSSQDTSLGLHWAVLPVLQRDFTFLLPRFYPFPMVN